MATQSEIEMEKALVAQLEQQGYARLHVTNESQIVDNFKTQVEKHNKAELDKHNATALNGDEFSQLLNKLNRGNVFDRSKQLRKKIDIERTDGHVMYLELFDTRHWCKNQFQVARQITNKSADNHARYDVTLLINGLPLVQIELKARGSEIRSAFDQIVRYRRKSYSSNSGLFDYIQLFIISNGVNTRYFANNKSLSYHFTFEWADIENQRINRLNTFTETFLEKCHLSKILARYVVQHETMRALMALRPYQYYAVERIIERVKLGRGDGYVWHTTGSGKTLTSFKTSQILSNNPHVDKVMFVVDRRDLDTQTALEFNAFSPDSVDPTENTKKLVEQLTDPNCKLILTTIQKLNAAISRKQFKTQCEAIQDKKFIFIFDECHRSQFGETHQRICDFFPNRQLFGFTGTPIFDANVVTTKYGKRTTEHLFGQALHKYVITDAIRDRNVLRFSVEYRGIKPTNMPTKQDSNDNGLTDKEYYESDEVIEKTVNDIIKIHDAKTHDREYNAMLAVSKVEVLQTYYRLFKEKKQAGLHDLKIVTIFSCAPGDSDEFSGIAEQDLPDLSKPVDESRLQFLKSCVADYNSMYGTSYTITDNKSFYDYHRDLSKRVKGKGIEKEAKADILLVVNMFLTGFDAPPLNTLYTDKNLQHHGLIQAYSRTNRLYDAKKSHGNIINYRDLKQATDDALTIFANRNSQSSVDEVLGTVIMEPYQDLVNRFKTEIKALKAISPNPDQVDHFDTEEAQLDFILKFRDVLRLQNTLKTFSEFDTELEAGNLGIEEQELVDYQSKFLDLRDQIEASDRAIRKEATEKAKEKKQQEEETNDGTTDYDPRSEYVKTILADLDFEIDLIKRDEITVGYILALIEQLKEESNPNKFEAQREMILDTLQSNPELRSKRNLFESFIDDELNKIEPVGDESLDGIVTRRFNQYVETKKQEAIKTVADEFKADPIELSKLYHDFVYRGTLPDRTSLLTCLKNKPGIRKRTTIADAMRDRLRGIYETFEDAEV